MVAEDHVQSLGFALVGERNGSPIKAEVAYVLGCELPLAHGHVHSASILCPIRRRYGWAIGIIGLSVANDFAIDRCATPLSVLVLLQNTYPSPLRQNYTGCSAIKRTVRVNIVAYRAVDILVQISHHRHAEGMEEGLATSRQDNICCSTLNRSVGHAQCV